jgi:hypothetical protein
MYFIYFLTRVWIIQEVSVAKSVVVVCGADTCSWLELQIGRRFFTTKNGYMGLCPSLARIDDQIVILLGGRTPFILRKTKKNRYRFIGECYVHGMMNGEGLGQNPEMQDFHIW